MSSEREDLAKADLAIEIARRCVARTVRSRRFRRSETKRLVSELLSCVDRPAAVYVRDCLALFCREPWIQSKLAIHHQMRTVVLMLRREKRHISLVYDREFEETQNV